MKEGWREQRTVRKPLGLSSVPDSCGFTQRFKITRVKKRINTQKDTRVFRFLFPSSKANFPAEGTKREKNDRNVTLFKGIPVQSTSEMPPLPIKSEMSSTSAAAAESTDWSSLLSVYGPQSHRHSFQWKDIIVWCAAYKNWGKATSFFLFIPLSSWFSFLFLLLFPCFLPLLQLLFTTLPRPLALVSVSVWSFAVRSQQTAVSWEDEGSARGDWYLKHTPHIQTHLRCFYPEEQQLCLEWKWGRQAYQCWENPCVHLSSFAVSLSLLLAPSSSLSTETVALRPLPFPVAPTNDQLQGQEAAC